MKNEIFQIGLNAVNGGVRSIQRNDDKDAMNWATGEKTWGLICSTDKKENGGLELIFQWQIVNSGRSFFRR